MIRKALIVFCDDTESGELPGPEMDNYNYHIFLESNLGGAWNSNEILSLQNPKTHQVKNAIDNFMSGADYTFIIFSGHGYINTDVRNMQYLELLDGDIALLQLRTDAPRQTLIIDACRGFYSHKEQLMKGLGESAERMFSSKLSTRKLFNSAVLKAEKGWTILYAASEDQTALDTGEGAAYLLSLLAVAKLWQKQNRTEYVLDLKLAHGLATIYLPKNFESIQIPALNSEKRLVHFPFAVKFIQIRG